MHILEKVKILFYSPYRDESRLVGIILKIEQEKFENLYNTYKLNFFFENVVNSIFKLQR